jgi:flagellar biosynthesis protein FlhF
MNLEWRIFPVESEPSLNMEPIAFTAASAEEAVAQIRARLGPEAVVLNVRPLPAQGLARLWQKPMIEVLAYRPESQPAPPAPPLADALEEFRQRLDQIEQHVKTPAGKTAAGPATLPEFADAVVNLDSGGWRIGGVLQRTGLLPIHAQRVVEHARSLHGGKPPASLAEEIGLARAFLAAAWRPCQPCPEHGLHIVIGPAGSGKTTCLCKWLTLAALVEGRLARVWRLDGTTANMAESLTVYCEILHVPGERAWGAGVNRIAEDIGFIDLPGVDWRAPGAIQELAGQLQQFGEARLHLALNGAYDMAVLVAQARAFAVLPIEDLIITHLDEESRWGKIWNLVLGTNYPIRYLSTGQNIPGDFCAASAEIILARQFPQGR